MTEPVLSLGFAAVDWIEHYLVHGPGDVQGQPIELDDEMAAFVVKAYRLDSDGARRVRRAFLSRAKGRNKSGTAAMIACFEALGPCRFDHWAEPGEVSDWGYEYEPGEPVGRPLGYVEILNVATEEGQAGNTYDAIYYMLNPETCSKALLADFGRIDVGLTRTNLPNQAGFIEPVTSADSSKDGGKSTFIVADETHLWTLPRLARLHGVMTRNLLKRKVASGWMLETSTMYAAGEGSVAEGTHDYAKRRKNDPALLFDHVQASEKYDLDDRAQRIQALREAYGPASSWMNLEAIADSWDDPQVSEGEFRRYWLNQPVSIVEKTYDFPVEAWAECEDPNPANSPAKMGAFAIEVDLDRAWASIGTAGVRADGRVHVEVIDRKRGTAWIVARCVELNAKHGPAKFVIDGAGAAQSLEHELHNAGIDVLIAGTSDVASACASFVDSVVDLRVAHGPDDSLGAAVEGCKRRAFRDGGFSFSRRRSGVDVTPLLAVILAFWATATADRAPEVWSLSEMAKAILAERSADSPPTTGASVHSPGVTFHPF